MAKDVEFLGDAEEEAIRLAAGGGAPGPRGPAGAIGPTGPAGPAPPPVPTLVQLFFWSGGMDLSGTVATALANGGDVDTVQRFLLQYPLLQPPSPGTLRDLTVRCLQNSCNRDVFVELHVAGSPPSTPLLIPAGLTGNFANPGPFAFPVLDLLDLRLKAVAPGGVGSILISASARLTYP